MRKWKKNTVIRAAEYNDDYAEHGPENRQESGYTEVSRAMNGLFFIFRPKFMSFR